MHRPLSKLCILSSGKEKIFEGPQCTKGVHEDPDEIFDTARGQKTELRKRSNRKRILIVGGGAAGFFGAIAAAQNNPTAEVVIAEKSSHLLTKVRISGGGRCNVTHNCFDPKDLIKNYPRGHRELLGAFHRFQPQDIINWFKTRHIHLKTESDGRIFPITDSSQTIINCFLDEASKLGIKILLRTPVENFTPLPTRQFEVIFTSQDPQIFDTILLATGGGASKLAETLGHTIIEPVPSLFTFNIKDPRLEDLSGVSFPQTHLSVVRPLSKLESSGPLLITHWGLSGPAILKLSAWGARILHSMHYHFELKANFLPLHSTSTLIKEMHSFKETLGNKQIRSLSKLSILSSGKEKFFEGPQCTKGVHEDPDEIFDTARSQKTEFSKRSIEKNPLFNFPKRFWEKMTHYSGIPEDLKWKQISTKEVETFAKNLTEATFSVHGKSTNKDEFVTCGGISLKEVNFKTMESKCCPGIYFAGEILDIDGITGGFNFQAAWTTAWIAGHSV